MTEDEESAGPDTGTLPAQLDPAGPSGEETAAQEPRFLLGERLGVGGMAEVFAAEDRLLSRQVALKVLRRSAETEFELRRRLVNEARAVVSLRHPNIVEVQDVDPSGRFIVMERIHGESLAQRLARGPLPRAELFDLARSILSALIAAHARGIIHRDIKPSNILLTREGRFKLGDFGVAHVPDSELTRSGVIVGTPRYMPPEQLRGAKTDGRSDLYALGATLYEAATGERLHESQDRPGVFGEVRSATQSAAFASLVQDLLQEDPAHRPPTAVEALERLERSWKRPALRALRWGALLLALGGAGLALRSMDSDRAKGLALLKRHQVVEADRRLGIALEKNPADAEARYYYTLARFWMSRPVDEINEQLRMVPPGVLEPWKYDVLKGIGLIVSEQLGPAIEHFQAVAAQHPDEVEVLYGLFEAEFHGGQPAAAVEVYRHILSIDPGFGLGAMHALDFLLSRGEDAAWVLKTTPPESRGLWSARAMVAARRYPEALTLIDVLIRDATADTVLPLLVEREHILAVTGQLVSADQAVREELTRSANVARMEELVLAAARGSSGALSLRDRYFEELIAPQSGFARTNRVSELASLESTAPDESGAQRMARELADKPRRRDELALAFTAARLHERETLAQLSKQSHPEVRSAALALLAELNGNPEEAGRFIADALEASSDGEFRIPEWFVAARVARAKGDTAALRRACDEVSRPRQFRNAWAYAARTCQSWLGETMPRKNP
ncbi:MAG: serine/threonine-protein kinase [Myxococcota bacterium]